MALLPPPPFDALRSVPRAALLNASSQVDAAGRFSSTVAKPRDRFLKVADQVSSQDHPSTHPCMEGLLMLPMRDLRH